MNKIMQMILGAKASEARVVSSHVVAGQAVSSPGNYNTYAVKGFQLNAMVYRCVSQIAQSVGGIEFEVYSKGRDGRLTRVDDTPLLTLLKRPNPMQSSSSFLEAVVGYYALSGNTYIESVGSQIPLELWPVRPDKMTIKPNKMGYPGAYVYKDQGAEKTWNVDFVKLKSQILHLKTFNPTDIWYGQAPLQAALGALDTANAGQRWNLALLQNSATPSGVLQMTVSAANPRGELSKDQYDRLREEVEDAYMGAKNAGRPLILEGGLSWNTISISPKDMEWKSLREYSSQDICTVYGVPGELVGLGQKTFNNYQEARLAFYEEVVLPLMDMICNELNRWLAPSFGDLVIGYNKDAIPAIAYKRSLMYQSIGNANYLNQNEKREAVGYEPVPGWDVFVIGQTVGAMPEDFAAPEPVDVTDPNADPNAEDTTQDPPPKKPAKKPAVDDAGDEGDDNELNGKAEWKSFHVMTQAQRMSTWKKQNRRRESLEKGFERDLAFELNEMADKLGKAVSNDAKLSEFEMTKIMDEEMKAISRTIAKHLRYTMDDFGHMILNEAKSIGLVTFETKARAGNRYEQYVQSYITKRTAKSITEIEGTTKKQVRAAVQKIVSSAIEDGDSTEEVAQQLTGKLKSLTPGRARTIARTEIGMASSNGSLGAAKSLGVPGLYKEWVSADDTRSRGNEENWNPDKPNHVDMNGERVSLDEKFVVPPDADMDCPGDGTAGAEQICNCRCVLTYGSET